MTHLESLLIATLVVVAYSYVAARISRAAQPLRIRVVDIIKRLHTDSTIPDEVKADLSSLQDHLLSKKAGWLIVILLPYVMLRSAIRGNNGHVGQLKHAKRPEIIQTMGMGMLCMIATSPLCAFIFVCELFISAVISRPGKSIRSLLHTVFSVDQKLSMRAI